MTTARELGQLSLEDAPALTEMLARVGDERFDAVAVRWLARLAVENEVSIEDLSLGARGLRRSMSSRKRQ